MLGSNWKSYNIVSKTQRISQKSVCECVCEGAKDGEMYSIKTFPGPDVVVVLVKSL